MRSYLSVGVIKMPEDCSLFFLFDSEGNVFSVVLNK
jgi:hypothetical protein